ncbi:MAG TPA: hypothetical protein VIE89_30410 [Candidatus Binatia bacterium]
MRRPTTTPKGTIRLMKIFRQSNGAEVWKSHVLGHIKQPQCWICEQSISAIDRDFFWFTSEQYYEPKVVDNLRLAHGFCPTHTRHFLQTGAKSVITAVFSYLSWYLIEQLNSARGALARNDPKAEPRQLCSKAAEILRPRVNCPMCTTLQNGEHVNVYALKHALALPEVRDAYAKSAGLCLPHFTELGSCSEWERLDWLAVDMQRRLEAKVLSERSTALVIEQAAGLDRDVILRRRELRKQTTELSTRHAHADSCIHVDGSEFSASPTMEQLTASLRMPGCPVCNACERGVRQYLEWLAAQMEAQPRVTDGWESTYNVCPAHLWRLYSAGHDDAALWIGRHTIHEWLTRLRRLTTGLDFKPSAAQWRRLSQAMLIWSGAKDFELGADFDPRMSRRSKVAAVLQSPRERLDSLRAIAFRPDECQACRHIRTITRQQLDLILRGLEDSVGRKAYRESFGLCLRHCVQAARIAEVPQALDELLSTQIARLRILEWELEEALRKSSWSVRYEPKGPETEAWRRAAYQFCGV